MKILRALLCIALAAVTGDIGQFLRHPDIQQRLAVLGLAISGTDTAETTAQFIRQQQASWRALAQELDLRPE
jgi:tripartite-type tricarboxylate transporter receptor subunit TctC